MDKQIWVEKYRPHSFGDIIGQDITKIEKAIQEPMSVPHFLFVGPAGTGKTSTAKVIAKILGADLLFLNASDKNGVDEIRDRVKDFVTSQSTVQGIPRLVLLDEADYLTPNAQAVLRGLMEQYHKNARFILTCNYPKKIIDPLQSRCSRINFVSPIKDNIKDRLKFICKEEKIVFDEISIETIVNAYYPDIRKCINKLQELSIGTNSILNITELNALTKNIYDSIISKDFRTARTLWIKNSIEPEGLILELFDLFYKSQLDITIKKKILIELADTDYKLKVGATPEIQLAGGILRVINHVGNI